jgi:hypothetical protein
MSPTSNGELRRQIRVLVRYLDGVELAALAVQSFDGKR